MRLVTFTVPGLDPQRSRIGALIAGDRVLDICAATGFSGDMKSLISSESSTIEKITRFANLSAADEDFREHPSMRHGDSSPTTTWELDQVALLPPLPNPSSLRDFYAFERHVAAAHAIRRKNIPEAWYEFPVFYFSNHQAIFGPEEVIPYPQYTMALDYELEVACIIGRQGMNIPADQAVNYIFGYTILNDWSARDVQRREMRVGLGPAKGKDFATSLGPCIVTQDELFDCSTSRAGVYDLRMTARVNGEIRSTGNWSEIFYSFAELIARASHEVYLYPGDVIGSGTVGSGCLLEITQGNGPWLQPGDIVELEVEHLGTLRNQIGEIRP